MTTLELGLQDTVELARRFGSRFCVLDSVLRCVCGGDIVKEGMQLSDMLHEHLRLPVRGFAEGSFTYDGHFYCIRVYSLSESSEYYLCEVLGQREAASIMEKTDGAVELLSLCSSMDYGLNELHSSIELLRRTLRDNGDTEKFLSVCGFERSLLRLSASVRNLTEYSRLMYAPPERVLFDAQHLCEKLTERCNAVLAKCGRYIEMYGEGKGIYICADGRQAVIALANAVQNALLYSPKDTVPRLTVRRLDDRTAEIGVANEDIMFTREDFSGAMDFAYQRTGCGLAVIRRFAELSHGSCELVRKDGTARLTLRLPLATEAEIADFRLEEPLTFERLSGGNIVEVLIGYAADLFM